MASKTQIQQLNNNNQLETLHPETDADIVTVDNSSGHYGGSATNVQAALEELFGKKDYGYIELDETSSGTLTDAQYAEVSKPYCIIKWGYRLFSKAYREGNDIIFGTHTVIGDQTSKTEIEYIELRVDNHKDYTMAGGSRDFYNKTQTDILLSEKQSKFTDGSATIASESGGVVTIKAGVKQTGGAIGNSSGSDITLGTAAKKNTGTGAGNVPILDANGKLSESVLPALAITDTFTVASQSAMLALTAQVGDIAIRTDLNKCFILKTAGASTLANWAELKTPTDVVQSVNGKTGAVTLEASDIKYNSSANNNTIKNVVDSVKTDVTNLKDMFDSNSLTSDGLVYTDENGKICAKRFGRGFIYAGYVEGDGGVDELQIDQVTTIAAELIGALPASKITSGTFDTARIPNLNASKITTGTFADARIASASTWNAKYTKPSGGIPSNDLATIYTNPQNEVTVAGTYSTVQVNAKGQVISGGQFIEVGTTGQTTPSTSLALGGIFFKKI